MPAQSSREGCRPGGPRGRRIVRGMVSTAAIVPTAFVAVRVLEVSIERAGCASLKARKALAIRHRWLCVLGRRVELCSGPGKDPTYLTAAVPVTWPRDQRTEVRVNKHATTHCVDLESVQNK